MDRQRAREIFAAYEEALNSPEMYEGLRQSILRYFEEQWPHQDPVLLEVQSFASGLAEHLHREGWM